MLSVEYSEVLAAALKEYYRLTITKSINREINVMGGDFRPSDDDIDRLYSGWIKSMIDYRDSRCIFWDNFPQLDGIEKPSEEDFLTFLGELYILLKLNGEAEDERNRHNIVKSNASKTS